MKQKKNVLITGAGGYIGNQLAQHLAENSDLEVYGIDIKTAQKRPNFTLLKMDIRDNHLNQLVADKNITHVVHLASIVSPGRDESLEYDIDVNGTKNVIEACKGNAVKHLTVTSSGAAYGYHANNPEWLEESHPLRGNDEFSYSRHKKQVEQLLADFSSSQSTTSVLILRPCTVLGKHTDNKITQLFERKNLLAVGTSDSPFVFIWDQDVIKALARGVEENSVGQFNLSGDGKLTIDELARITNKKVTRVPVGLLKGILRLGRWLGLTNTGPEQVVFLQYRPVLSNQRLKQVFGYTPIKTSKQTFEFFWQNRRKS